MSWLQQVWIDFWRYTSLYPIEGAVLLVLASLACIPPLRRARVFATIGRVARHLGRRTVLAMAVLFTVTLVGHGGLDKYRYPTPAFHDEYSYLLAADTFASGRLTNPPHPMGVFFESFHILIDPTYMSMYPPGQGLALALGQVLGGDPAIGVWLSCAALSAALFWMLRAWVGPQWALLGGLLAAVRIGWFSYWGNSYWGGAVSGLGGALILGAAGYLLRGRRDAALGLWLAMGGVILAYTRIWEGTILSATILTWLVIKLWRLRSPLSALSPVLTPFVVVTLAGVVFLGYYNWRVTGNALRLPYLENRDRYEVHPTFVWQAPTPNKAYNHDILRKYYVESEGYRDQIPYWQRQAEKPKRIWFFLVGPALTLPILFAAPIAFRARYLLPLTCLGTFGAAHLLVAWNLLPHYAGPVTGAIYVLLVAGFRVLALWRRRSLLCGAVLSRAAIATVVVMAAVRIAGPSLQLPVYGEYTLPWYSFGLHANTHRAGIERKLGEVGGKHLILVDYDTTHIPDFEWVYNRADIDAATVVWARMTPRRDLLTQLLVYFRDRRVWVVYPDQNPGRLLTFEERIR
ncbi:MAG: hypothetical protein JNK87_15800 [Bryobacterales bacterium]|nr:hypothetical protein [Bryobacterales bacterium]